MKFLFENWREFLKEEEEEDESNVLDLSKELDSGFCDFNPLINQFAQHEPDTLAEMLIFVVATQQMRWYDVVPKFPLLMTFVKQEGGLLNPETSYVDEKGKTIYKIPKEFAQLALSFRKNSIQYIWENREQIFATFSPLFNTFNTAGEDSMAKEEAIFQIYLELIKLPGLGLPKAAFASQLLIGRLGCIDSINLNLYKGLDPEGKLITYDKSGKPTFKTPGVSKKGGIIQVTKGGIKLASNYVKFLKEIARMTETSEAQLSKQLWDSWVELVSLKINKKGDIDVIMPGGEKFVVPNDYSKNIKGAETNPSAAFRKKYIGNITGQDVSRQHFPPKMYENYQRWTSYVGNIIKEEMAMGALRGTLAGIAGLGRTPMAADKMPYKKNYEYGPDTVMSVKAVLHRNSKVLLLKNKKGWDLPGGHVREGENNLDALMREVFEETGLNISGVQNMNFQFGRKHFFSGQFLSDDVTLSEEHSEYGFFSLEEIQNLDNISSKYLKAINMALGGGSTKSWKRDVPKHNMLERKIKIKLL